MTLTPVLREKALIRGRTVSSQTQVARAVTRQFVGPRPSLLGGAVGAICRRAPPLRVHPTPMADPGAIIPPCGDTGRGRPPGFRGPSSHGGALSTTRCVPGDLRVKPRHPKVSEAPWDIPSPDPGGGGLLPAGLAAWSRASAPSTAWARNPSSADPRRLGHGLQRFGERPLVGPGRPGWDRPRRCGPFFFGRERRFRAQAVAPPSANARDRRSVLRWVCPAFPPPGVFVAGISFNRFTALVRAAHAWTQPSDQNA